MKCYTILKFPSRILHNFYCQNIKKLSYKWPSKANYRTTKKNLKSYTTSQNFTQSCIAQIIAYSMSEFKYKYSEHKSILIFPNLLYLFSFYLDSVSFLLPFPIPLPLDFALHLIPLLNLKWKYIHSSVKFKTRCCANSHKEQMGCTSSLGSFQGYFLVPQISPNLPIK